tara:strand:+ start:13742 stop:14806 length:1065 start_codon:yes stop_codon:yes gene_type:complete
MLITGFLFCVWQHQAMAMSCLNIQGQAVDWWVVIKLPKSADPTKTGDSFVYFDAKAKQFTLLKQTVGIDRVNEPVGYTLNQLYNHANTSHSLGWLMYNDEPPVSTRDHKPTGGDFGHTKGVIGFNQKTGFWLIDSVPKFPSVATQQYSYPDTATTYGQSLLCVSINTDQLPVIAKQLQYSYPHIYSAHMPSTWQLRSTFSRLWQVMQYQGMQEKPRYSEQTFYSQAQQPFVSIVKSYPENTHLFYEYVASYFKQPLLAETWLRGQQEGSVCQPYVVNDVETLAYPSHTTPRYAWKETQDHSKWAVSNKAGGSLVCVGDLNRMRSQRHRAGGTVCIKSQALHQAMYPMVVTHHSC